MTTEQAKQEFIKIFGKIDEKSGYSITSKKVKNGILVIKWYGRNTWTDPVVERKILFSNGHIFENNKRITPIVKNKP